MATDRDSHEVAAVLSAGKALAIVEVLLQAPGPLSAREIGERRGVNRTTAHRLLNSLIVYGWVERIAEGGYRVSVRFLAVAHISAQVRGLFGEIKPALIPFEADQIRADVQTTRERGYHLDAEIGRVVSSDSGEDYASGANAWR